MRQVPHYLLIGNGRVSRHFQAYFSQLSLSYAVWHRQLSSQVLQKELGQATHVLVLIRDDAIEPFIKQHLHDYAGKIIHCSGSLVTQLAYGAHPLMTFSNQMYPQAVYQSIPFILDNDAPTFAELLPGLPNQHQRLNQAEKVKYHAFCVMAGNFSCLLWQQLFALFQDQYQWSMEVAYPYLRQQMQNLMDQPMGALTGPLARHDHGTIQRHLSALSDHPQQALYQAFVEFYHANQQETVDECV